MALLEFIVKRAQKNWDFKQSNREDVVGDMSVTKALGLFFNMRLSNRSYTELRQLMKEVGATLPPRNKLDEAKSHYHPPIQSFELKSSVNFRHLLLATFRGLHELCREEITRLHLEDWSSWSP